MSREYVVLRAFETAMAPPDDPGWYEHAKVTAHSARAAVIQAADGKDGEYVAIPARQWKPLRVKVEQTVRVKVTEEPVA